MSVFEKKFLISQNVTQFQIFIYESIEFLYIELRRSSALECKHNLLKNKNKIIPKIIHDIKSSRFMNCFLTSKQNDSNTFS